MAHKFEWRGDEVKKLMLARGNAVAYWAAEYMAKQAFAYCPKDTGELAGSIFIDATPDHPKVLVYVGAYYAPFVELGHINVWTGQWVPGVHFLDRALRDTAEAFPGIVKQKFWRDAGSGTIETTPDLGTPYSYSALPDDAKAKYASGAAHIGAGLQ